MMPAFKTNNAFAIRGAVTTPILSEGAAPSWEGTSKVVKIVFFIKIYLVSK
jgi:hypothetical protein